MLLWCRIQVYKHLAMLIKHIPTTYQFFYKYVTTFFLGVGFLELVRILLLVPDEEMTGFIKSTKVDCIPFQ